MGVHPVVVLLGTINEAMGVSFVKFYFLKGLSQDQYLLKMPFMEVIHTQHGLFNSFKL